MVDRSTRHQPSPAARRAPATSSSGPIWACPRSGPYYKDDGISELYLLYPQREDEDGIWSPSEGLGSSSRWLKVSTILLVEDPTGASPEKPALAP
jgi:hypothetical protein